MFQVNLTIGNVPLYGINNVDVYDPSGVFPPNEGSSHVSLAPSLSVVVVDEGISISTRNCLSCQHGLSLEGPDPFTHIIHVIGGQKWTRKGAFQQVKRSCLHVPNAADSSRGCWLNTSQVWLCNLPRVILYLRCPSVIVCARRSAHISNLHQ